MEPASLTTAYSDYEMTAIHDAETRLGVTLDPTPEGKTIEHIEFLRLPPIDRHDPLPAAVNVAHATTKEYVVRRALFVKEGDHYQKAIVDESARSLRSLRQLSLVVCAPVHGSHDDTVRLVVITKDVWSLYVDFDLALTSGGLESLTLEPKETNIAGVHHAATGRFVLEPKTMTAGASYEIPRLDGRWLSLSADANAIIHRESGELEGGNTTTKIQRPLFFSKSKWAWSVQSQVSNQIRRRYVNAEVATFENRTPWQWRERSVNEEASVTRSFGWAAKNDVTFGAYVAHARYDTDDAEFRKAAVPIGEDRVGPYLQWRSYRSDFLRTFDLAGLALQEDQRLGYDLTLRAYPSLQALGATRDVIGGYAKAAYGMALGDGVARASVETTIESDTTKISDAWVKGSLGIATPRFGPKPLKGRFVMAMSTVDRMANYLNAHSFLGGDSLLRGYPSRALVGQDLVTANLEYRTRSFDLVAIQVGAVAFFDAGDAFDRWADFDPKQSVGGGLRVVFPQIDRAVLRLDLGVPIHRAGGPEEPPPFSFFVAFHQALELP
jgi:hypothetical protein